MLSNRMLLPIMLLPMLLLALGLGWGSAAQAAPCEPEASGWQPTRYYTAGAAVFHDGQWYQARQINEGKEPGISFDWKELKAAPECDSAQTQKQQAAEKPRTKTKGTAGTGNTNPNLCQRPEQWRFAESYIVGSLTTHGGMVWEAIRPTNGDMPGMKEPPHWRPVEEHCSLQLDN